MVCVAVVVFVVQPAALQNSPLFICYFMTMKPLTSGVCLRVFQSGSRPVNGISAVSQQCRAASLCFLLLPASVTL